MPPVTKAPLIFGLLTSLYLSLPLARADLTAVPSASAPSSIADDPAALQKSAQAAMQAKNWVEAVGLWDRYLTLKSDDASGHRNRGRSLLKLDRLDDAVAAYRKAAELVPSDVIAWGGLCWTLIVHNKPQEAQAGCQKAVELEPTNYAALVNLGHTYLLQGDSQGAQPWYQKTLINITDADELKDGPLGDFDIFISKSWQMQASQQAKAWFEKEGAVQLARWEPVNQLLQAANAADKEKDYARSLSLREQRLPLLSALLGPDHPRVQDARKAVIDTRYQLADQLYAKADYAQALAIYQQVLAFREQYSGADSTQTAFSLNDVAKTFKEMGQYDKALPLFSRALAISEKAKGPEHPSTGASLNNLALLYESMGQYDKALPLYTRALAISEKANGPEHPSIGISLNNLALLYRSMGQYAQALPLYARALAINEKANGPEHPSTGTYLNNLAGSYQSMGQYDKALPLYTRALAIREKVLGPEHPDIGISLNNLAELYRAMGQYAQALPLYTRALAISEKVNGPEHPSTSTRLNNLAGLYESMGQYAQALPLSTRALAIREKVLGTEHPDAGGSLNNLAGLYQSMGQYDKALPLFTRALAISEKANGPEHSSTGITLNNLAGLYYAMGHYDKALPLYTRALAISEKANGPEHPRTGSSLNNLAGLYYAMGQYDKASPLYTRAYRIALNAGEPQLLQRAQGNLSQLLKAQNKPEAAIFFGKQAVNTLQGLRASVAGLGKDTLKSFDATVESTYRSLSGLLISEGRLVEAERVLELLKEQEQFQFVRRDATLAPTAGRATLSAFEATQDQILMQAGAPLAQLYSELSALDNNKTRSAAEESRRQSLQAQLTQAGEAFQQTFDRVLATLTSTRHDKVEEIKDAQGLQDTLRELGDRLGEPVVALYTVVDPESYSLILTTAEYRRAYTVPIKAQALNAQIAAWRNTLKNQTLDPVPQARALLDVILPPAARAELQQAKAGTLMWHLDGALRLLPLAALHDGEKYLVQRYRLTTFTPASLGNLKDVPKARWNALGLGVSQARMVDQRSFTALPAVAQELDTVVRQPGGTGVMPGTRLLNPEFTWTSVQDELKRKGKYPLIHIASHFNLEPGNDTMSYLLTGAGEPITLAQLVRQNNLFGGVDLLTLSACETGVGAGQDSNGREVDGLSFIAQRQGAKAVMATLWPVADASTAQLMERFYQLRENGHLTKAEALRQAQVSLLQGTGAPASAPVATQATPDERGAQRVSAPGRASAAAFAANPGAPFAHPYFWAPFILMGNWL